MSALFERVTIIGVGLLGASLGLALKQRDLVGSVVGVGRRGESLAVAVERKAIDESHLDIARGVAGADLIVIATPAALVVPVLDSVLAVVPPHTIITDVASTKKTICAHAAKVCPSPRRFIGCHPMAGSEKFGPEHGSADLYEKTVCLMEQDDALDPAARESLCRLWRGVGARVVDITPDVHDAFLARTSHTPHVLAAVVAILAADFGVSAEFAGNSFRDVTRIAGSRPELWRDICLENRDALIESLRRTRLSISEFETRLEAGDAQAVAAFFQQAVASRRKVVGS